jgi:hypothetical protein
MKSRIGEKLGWIGGWLGSFLWLLIVTIEWLVQGRSGHAAIGAIVLALGIILIFVLAPWRWPQTEYWKLLSPMIAVFLAAAGSCMWLEGGLAAVGLSPWNLLWLGLLVLPFATAGRRRWSDGDT